MIRTKKLILSLLTALFFAASAFAILRFGTSIPYARAAADEPSHGYEHTTELSAETVITDGGKYYLENNLTRNIVIPANSKVELCLNGKTLTGTGTGYVITVEDGAELKLHDCSGDNAGKIIGGNDVDGGGIKAEGNGSLTMTGGTISANNSTGNGVYISGSRSSMSDGVITGFSTGVYIQGGSFTMTGGTVTKNGTGVYGNQTLHLSGTPKIVDNTDKNAHIRKKIEMSGELEEGARIGVTLESGTGIVTDGYTEKGNTEHPSKYFFPDDDSYNIALNDGEAEISTTVEIAGIKAVFNQGDTLIYDTTELNSLKAYLEVKVVNNDGTYYNDGTPLNDGDYELSGELTTSESVITVTYGTYKTTFTVTVSIESPCDPPVDDPVVTPKPADEKEGNLLWLVITLSVILLADAGILIYQLIGRKKSGTDNENAGDNK